MRSRHHRDKTEFMTRFNPSYAFDLAGFEELVHAMDKAKTDLEVSRQRIKFFPESVHDLWYLGRFVYS